MTRFSIKLFIVLVCSCVLMPEYTHARVNSITGTLSMREGYDSNIYRTKDNEVSGWTTTISPILNITSQGKNDSLSFVYGPGFTRDHEREETKVDQHLDLIGAKNFSQTFRTSLRETYIRTSDTYLQSEVLIDEVRLLRPDKTKERLWTNTVFLQMDYTFAQESVFNLAYTNYILEHTSSGPYNDYIRHNPSTSLTYRLNDFWSVLASYSYIKGDFDESPDLKTHAPGLQLRYRYSPKTTFFGSYGFNKTDYTGDGNQDYKYHDVSLGTDHDINPLTNISLSAGFSRTERQTNSQNAFNYGLNLTKGLKGGSLSVRGSGGFTQADFDGSDDGLSRYWSIGGSLNYQLTEKSNVNAYARIRHDDYLEQSPSTEEYGYNGGGGFSFLLTRWLTISLQYGYLQVDADNSTNDYVDHRFYIALAAAKELWRW